MEQYDNKKDWLKARGIGGTDAAVILGKSPYKTPYELIKELKGNIKSESVDNKATIRGRESEKPIRDLFAIDFPQYEVIDRTFSVFRHKDYPFLTASLDAELIDKETNKKGVYEIKTCDKPSMYLNGIPEHYRIQMLHYLMITGYDFAVHDVRFRYFGEDGVIKTEQQRIFIKVDDNVKKMLNRLLEVELEFWNNSVLGNALPSIKL